MPLLADFLNLVKDFLLDDRRVGAIENCLLFQRRVPLLLVPNGIGVGLEVDRTAGIFPPFQNVDNGVGVPVIGIRSLRAGGLDARPALVGGGVEHLFLLQELCDLHRPAPFHAKSENTLDHLCCRFVHNPLCPVIRVFEISKRDIGGQRYAALALCLLHRTDFAAGIFCKKLVEPVLDTCHIVVGAVGVDGVKVVVDGDIPHSILRESEVDIQPGQR